MFVIRNSFLYSTLYVGNSAFSLRNKEEEILRNGLWLNFARTVFCLSSGALSRMVCSTTRRESVCFTIQTTCSSQQSKFEARFRSAITTTTFSGAYSVSLRDLEDPGNKLIIVIVPPIFCVRYTTRCLYSTVPDTWYSVIFYHTVVEGMMRNISHI